MPHFGHHLRNVTIRLSRANTVIWFFFLTLSLSTVISADDAAADAQASPSQLVGKQILDYLNQTIDWYRDLAVEETGTTDPADLLFVNDDRQMASQIVRQSFDFARTAAQQVAAQTPPAATQSPSNSRLQNLLQIAAKTDQMVKDTQAEIEQLQNKLQTVTARERPKLEATLDELKSELALAQPRSEALHNILQFASIGSAGASGGNLLAQVQELQRSVPEATLTNPNPTAADGQKSVQTWRRTRRRPAPMAKCGRT